MLQTILSTIPWGAWGFSNLFFNLGVGHFVDNKNRPVQREFGFFLNSIINTEMDIFTNDLFL